MLKRFLAFAAIAIVAFGVLGGCDSNGDQQRSVVTVTSINCNGPGYADVADSTGALRETWVPVYMYNRPYNGLVVTDPASPHGEFQVTAYRITWTTAGGTQTMPARLEETSFSIPTGSEVGAMIRLVSLGELTSPLLSGLVGGGTETMVAHFTFYGHETGTDRETEVTATVTVVFANYVDSEPTCTL